MRQQTRIKDQQIVEWEQEIEKSGMIAEEGPLISRLAAETNPVILSTLLSLASISRLNANNSDILAQVWLQIALQLDSTNERAKIFLLQTDWLKFKGILDVLTFPTIRETDNRTAKKKIAEEYIQICRSFLNEYDEHLHGLKEKEKLAFKVENKTIYHQFEKLAGLLDAAMETVVLLLKAAEEYDQSITGVFHTSTYYEEIKQQFSRLEEIKKEWLSLFLTEEKSPSNRSDSLEELKEMIGLDMVKERVLAFYRFLVYQQHRKELGFQSKDDISLNMILTGNPGTGKTTLARLLAKIYHELGVMPREEVIEADRSQLVGTFVGQTEENVRKMVEKAVGGVLFVDEAYSLKREGQSGNDYGQTAIDTLVSLMTGNEYGGKFAVILAGYPDEMRTFMDANPGLRSRFPRSNLIHLPNYSNEELLKIAEKMASENDYLLTEDAKIELEHRLEQERVDDTFGNARTVRNIVLDAIFKKGAQESSPPENILHFTLLNRDDFRSQNENQTDSPSEALNQLIGLHEIKTEMRTLVSIVKMQQFRRMNGLPVVPVQLHAVFTGNPGTGKTTVAKIYAELLKECGVLKRGHLITSSRADFVAGYVGQTAVKSRKLIRSALGGVLFIDEAYSLFSPTSSDFGKEAVDTLVDEMTKHNENLVVILAGYPNEMSYLLDSNPGLRSRFKKFFHFLDYTSEELIEIMESYAEQFQYRMTKAAKEIILASMQNKWMNGNGRFAANLADEMIQAQALRLMSTVEAECFLIEKAQLLEEADAKTALIKMKMIVKEEGDGNG